MQVFFSPGRMEYFRESLVELLGSGGEVLLRMIDGRTRDELEQPQVDHPGVRGGRGIYPRAAHESGAFSGYTLKMGAPSVLDCYGLRRPRHWRRHSGDEHGLPSEVGESG